MSDMFGEHLASPPPPEYETWAAYLHAKTPGPLQSDRSKADAAATYERAYRTSRWFAEAANRDAGHHSK